VLRTALGYIAAVIVTHVVGAGAAAQHVIGKFELMSGHSVALGERVSWTLRDIVGMASQYIYPIAIAVMLLIAFAVAGFVVRRIGGLRTFGFVVAGALGMISLHLILNNVFGSSAIAASRELSGLLFQGLAGALGGMAYVALHPAGKPGVERSSRTSESAA